MTWCWAEIRTYHLPDDERMRQVLSHGRRYLGLINNQLWSSYVHKKCKFSWKFFLLHYREQSTEDQMREEESKGNFVQNKRGNTMPFFVNRLRRFAGQKNYFSDR